MRDVIYNNVKINNYVIVKDIKESLLPDVNNISLKLKDNVGVRFIKQEMGVRRFDIDIEIIADSLEEKQEFIDRLAPLLFSNSERELILDNNRKYKAVLDGSTNMNSVMYDGSTTLTFIAHNPIAYGEEVSIDFSNNDSLFNAGNYKTRGVIQLTSSSSTIRVELGNGGDYDYIEVYNLNPDDIVIIDFVNEIVKVNGKEHMKHTDPLGDFFDIPVGEFRLKTSGVKSSTLSFYERWI